MKATRTVIITKEVEVEVSLVVMYRNSELADMCSYSPAGPWKIYAICDTEKQAKKELKNAKEKYGAWHDYKIAEMTEDEITKFKKK